MIKLTLELLQQAKAKLEENNTIATEYVASRVQMKSLGFTEEEIKEIVSRGDVTVV